MISARRRAILYLYILFIELTITVQAVPILPPTWLGQITPKKGETLQDEIKCYSLPYGAIGFASHALTYWTVGWLGAGRKPYWPPSKLSSGNFDLLLAVTQIIITVLIASFTIYRCQERWQFVVIAVWKMTLSVEVGIWGVSAALKAKKSSKDEKDQKKTDSRGYTELQNLGSSASLPISDRDSKRYSNATDYSRVSSGQKYESYRNSTHSLPQQRQNSRQSPITKIWDFRDWTPYTLLLYVVGYCAGMSGLLSLAWQFRGDHNMRIITASFAVAAFSVIFVILMLYRCFQKCANITKTQTCLGCLFCCVMVGALYSDWVLAEIAGSLTGYPTGDNGWLYWAYIGAKRLPLFFT